MLHTEPVTPKDATKMHIVSTVIKIGAKRQRKLLESTAQVFDVLQTLKLLAGLPTVSFSCARLRASIANVLNCASNRIAHHFMLYCIMQRVYPPNRNTYNSNSKKDEI
eukprot:2187018-Amphidinium_carterae.2